MTTKTQHQLFIERLEAEAKLKGKPLSDGARQAKKRPTDYCELSPPEEQWAVDKRLGILDWDGT